jgi:predicted porin
MGLFKTPGAEEGLQAIHVFDYINFTWVTNQMLLERHPNKTYTSNVPPQTLPPGTPLNGFDRSVSAYRDVGVQVFDWFKVGNDWELSYAAMIGNGNGLNFSDNDDNKDVYLYGSMEKVYGGSGPRREGLKFWAWSQNGRRTADLTNDSIHNPEEYDRDRWGVGAKYLRKGLRLSAEYMKGEGMIFQAPHNPSFGLGPAQGNPNAPAGHGAYAEAEGYYVEGGYRIPGTRWELDLRYDMYHRLDGDRFQIDFDRTTIGVQYFFNPRVRAAFNYEIRSGDAVNFPSGAGPNAQVEGIDDRIGIQVTAIWSQ